MRKVNSLDSSNLFSRAGRRFMVMHFSLLLMLLWCCGQTKQLPGSIDAAQFKEMLKKNNVVLIDVRTPEEFSQGHIPGARMIDYLQTETFRKELNRLDKNKTYLLYCRSGNRSKQAMQEMIQSGFKNVYELKGGIKSWPGELVK